jgi:hypothetical protein
MLKNVKVGDVEISLQSSGATPIFYANEFKRDFFKDFSKVIKFASEANEESKAGSDMSAIISMFESGIILKFMDFAYIYAKNANHSISDEETWLESFDVFPILDILEDMIELMMSSLTVKKTYATNSKRTKASTVKVSSTSRKKQA